MMGCLNTLEGYATTAYGKVRIYIVQSLYIITASTHKYANRNKVLGHTNNVFTHPKAKVRNTCIHITTIITEQ